MSGEVKSNRLRAVEVCIEELGLKEDQLSDCYNSINWCDPPDSVEKCVERERKRFGKQGDSYTQVGGGNKAGTASPSLDYSSPGAFMNSCMKAYDKDSKKCVAMRDELAGKGVFGILGHSSGTSGSDGTAGGKTAAPPAWQTIAREKGETNDAFAKRKKVEEPQKSIKAFEEWLNQAAVRHKKSKDDLLKDMGYSLTYEKFSKELSNVRSQAEYESLIHNAVWTFQEDITFDSGGSLEVGGSKTQISSSLSGGFKVPIRISILKVRDIYFGFSAGGTLIRVFKRDSDSNSDVDYLPLAGNTSVVMDKLVLSFSWEPGKSDNIGVSLGMKDGQWGVEVAGGLSLTEAIALVADIRYAFYAGEITINKPENINISKIEVLDINGGIEFTVGDIAGNLIAGLYADIGNNKLKFQGAGKFSIRPSDLWTLAISTDLKSHGGSLPYRALGKVDWEVKTKASISYEVVKGVLMAGASYAFNYLKLKGQPGGGGAEELTAKLFDHMGGAFLKWMITKDICLLLEGGAEYYRLEPLDGVITPYGMVKLGYGSACK